MSLRERATVAQLFAELVELAPEERLARLDALAREQPSVATEVRELLAADDAAGDFLGVLSGTSESRRSVRDAGSAPSPNDDVSPMWRRRVSSDAGADSGRHVGPYILERPLGRGGMATVWLARDTRLDRRVALKLFPLASHPDDPETIADGERFQKEARVAARIDHPHVAAIYDVGETPDGVRYLAMAYCEGGSLADRLTSGPLSIPESLRVARELASALAAAHAQHVVHRDVKPGNVLFDAADGVRLADFGIAKLSNTDSTRSGGLVGTIAYLAPEQLHGAAPSFQVDLWALGVTLYEMLAGTRPFTGASYASLMHAILTTNPEPLVRRRSEVPPALDVLISRLLAKDPSERIQSANDVLRILSAVGTSPPPPNDDATPRDESGGVRSTGEFLASRASAIPLALTTLIGRERELTVGAALLSRARLVTLTGSGGVGKTRLAMELARLTAPRYEDGVFLVSLANIPAADGVAAGVLQAVSPRTGGNDEPARRLQEFFARAHALLVLDNFEHVLDAAALVASLLAAAPQLTILVTSRATLRLQGEHELPVPPLALPRADEGIAENLGTCESVRLFVQRASAVRPDFALTSENAEAIAAICRRLDGLPLAIELAAARTRLLSPQAILQRLTRRFDLLRSDARDVVPRHRTMRDVIEWSIALLSESERSLFEKLSIFSGGFAIEAAQRIGGDDSEGDILDRVASLLEKSLLVRRDGANGESRFDMLESLREFGQERLLERGVDRRVRAAHRDYYLALAEEAATHARGPEQQRWTEVFLTEADNFISAIEFSIAHDELDVAARLCLALHRYWLIARSFLGSGLAQLQRIEERAQRLGGDHAFSRDRSAQLLTVRGLLHAVWDDVPGSTTLYQRALPMFAEAGDEVHLATTLNHLGWNSFLLGEFSQSEAYSREARAIHERRGHELGVAISSVNLGWIAHHRGRLEESDRLFREALSIHQRRGDPRSISFTRLHLAALDLRRGRYERAAQDLGEVIECARALGDGILLCGAMARLATTRHEGMLAGASPNEWDTDIIPPLRKIGMSWALGFALSRQGMIVSDEGNYDRARELLQESVNFRTRARDRAGWGESITLLAETERRRRNLKVAAQLFTEALDSRLTIGEPIGVVECVEGIGAMAIDHGDFDVATRLLAGAAAERERVGAPLPLRYRDDNEQRDRTLERELGSYAWFATVQEGRASAAPVLAALAREYTAFHAKL